MKRLCRFAAYNMRGRRQFLSALGAADGTADSPPAPPQQSPRGRGGPGRGVPSGRGVGSIRDKLSEEKIVGDDSPRTNRTAVPKPAANGDAKSNGTPAPALKAIEDVAKVAKEAITQATLAMAQSQRCVHFAVR